MYIFVVRFLLISVMKLVEGAIYYLIEYMCIISLFLKLATFVRRDDSTDIPRERLYINISVGDVLYINDWRGCLLLSLSSTRVLLALGGR